jgi:F420-non-reducing hydrogenase iron-sulfur subunit
MCSGESPIYVLKSFKEGADGVFVGGCHMGDCHYDAGIIKWRRRAKFVEDLLPEFGIDKERFRFEWISASGREKIPENHGRVP